VVGGRRDTVTRNRKVSDGFFHTSARRSMSIRCTQPDRTSNGSVAAFRGTGPLSAGRRQSTEEICTHHVRRRDILRWHVLKRMLVLGFWRRLLDLYSIPCFCCSLRSSHTVFPEQEQTTLSLSHTPALLATTPTNVSASSFEYGPSMF
jgi:hypothetical protein